jgi:phage baseplate assembly protein W
MARSDKFTVNTNKVEYYSDFTTNFDKNPVTGFLARNINEEAIKSALRNLVLTQRTERFYNANIGSKLYALLFDPLDDITADLIAQEIRTTIKNDEPRVVLGEVRCTPSEDLNAFIVDVIFGIANIPDKEFSLNLVMKRWR